VKKSFEKITLLNKEIEIKNMLIGELLHVISKNKIVLPNYIIKIIEGLYLKNKHEHVVYGENTDGKKI
jgi:hypothetical protein